MGAGIPVCVGGYPSGSKNLLVLAFSDRPTPLDQQTHFVLHIFCCFAITTRECNSSLCFSKKVYILTKKLLAHSRKT